MNKKSIFNYLLPLILGVLLLALTSNILLNNSGKSSSQVDNVYNLYDEKKELENNENSDNEDFYVELESDNNLKISENEIEVIKISELLFTKNCKYTKKINSINELENEFLIEVENLANKYGVLRDDFLTIFSLETIKTFSPCILNPYNNAIGLIQFTGKTLEEDIEVSFDEMAKTTRVEQLEYVDKYLSKYKSDIDDLTSLYLVIFLPSVIKESSNEDFVIPQKYYKQNTALDENNDGEIKISEINYYLEEYRVS